MPTYNEILTLSEDELLLLLEKIEVKDKKHKLKTAILKMYNINFIKYKDVGSKFIIYIIKNKLESKFVTYCTFDDINACMIKPLSINSSWKQVSALHKRISYNKNYGSALADEVLVNHFEGIDNIDDIWAYYNKPVKCVICNKPLHYEKFYRTIFRQICSDSCYSVLKSERMKNGKNPRTLLSRERWKEIDELNGDKLKQRILKGTFTPCVTNSRCKSRVVIDNIPFRSSWEAYFYIYKQYIDKEVIQFEKLRIKYFNSIDNNDRIYIVDFIDTINKKVYEIKPEGLIDITVQEKEQALIKWCSDNEYEYIMISDDWFKQNYYPDIIYDNIGINMDTEGMTRKLKQFNKNITEITTIQPFEYTGDTFNLHVEDNHNYFADGFCVSNCHGLKLDTKSAEIVLKSNAKIRLGLTGTLPDDEISTMAILSCVGAPKRYITTQGLIERGLATPVNINVLQLKYGNEDKSLFKYVGNYTKKLQFIKEHENRNLFIAKLSNLVGEKGNTVIMCSHIEHMKNIFTKLIALKDPSIKVENSNIVGKNSFEFQKKYGVYYVAGATKQAEREKIIEILKENSTAILVSGYQLFSTGLNIKALKNIIFASPLKSYTTISQSIGRAIRLHISKNTAEIYDIVDDFSVRGNSGPFYAQYLERLQKSYNSEGFPITQRVINI